MRFKFDPAAAAGTRLEATELVNVDGEMPKVDARYETKPYSTLFLAMHDPKAVEAAIGGTFNSLAKCNVKDGTYEYWHAGNSTDLSEVAFVPRSADGTSTRTFKSLRCARTNLLSSTSWY